MKTALTELIERLDAQHEVIPVEVYRKGLEYAKAVATELLEKERQQIVDGVDDALIDETGNEYYHRIYKYEKAKVLEIIKSHSLHPVILITGFGYAVPEENFDYLADEIIKHFANQHNQQSELNQNK